jgi:Leucine-rich repeat (LRR) protein
MLPDLIALKLANNEIASLAPLAKKATEEGSVRWASLEELDLSYNRIVDVEEVSCPKLRVLNLGWNDIRRIEGIENSEFLEELNLCNNQIGDCSKLRGLRRLRRLFIVC